MSAPPFDRESIVIRINGAFGQDLATVTDTWSTGFRLAVVGGGPITNNDLTVFLESISPAVSTFHQTGHGGAGAQTFLRQLTGAVLGVDGKYKSKATPTFIRDYLPAVGGGAVAGIHPWNTATVLSLRTLNKRGLASNGRMYWPAVAVTVQSATGRLGTAHQNQIATGAQTMLKAINTAAETHQTGLRIHVLSRGGLSGIPAASMVTSVRVDERLDSIERRENDQPAAWIEKAV